MDIADTGVRTYKDVTRKPDDEERCTVAGRFFKVLTAGSYLQGLHL